MRKLNVNTAMSRPLKSTPQAKRVAPPAVPSEVHRRSGTSFGSSPSYSAVEDGGFTQTRDSPAALKDTSDITDYGITHVSSKSPNSLNPYVTTNAFTFPMSSRGEPLTHKVAVYYHQQLALQEDQGIDLTQSPGRDSPGSSSGSAGSGSRHSTASLDSGRASSYITGCGTSTRGALSSPRCSVSSCSIGSVDRMSQRSDNDIIMDWLIDIKFEEYAQLFSSAGYDLPTIARMTPEDLTAIGIKNPQHRERIKQHIDVLHVPDGLPNFVPGSIEEWLRLLRLEEYIQPLLDQNYKTVRDVTQVTWEDLEDIGIVKLGHQKKILLAIKRVKDIISGKWNPKANNMQQDYHTVQSSRMSWDDSQGICNECSSINHENNDIVVIKIRQPRGKSLESLEDINEQNARTHLTFSHYSNDCYSYFPQQQISRNVCMNPNLPYHVGNLAWRRSYDDGDITPTNDVTTDLNEGGGTLPRQRISSSGRCRLIERSNSATTSQTGAMIPSHMVSSVDYCPVEGGGAMLSSNTRYVTTCSPLAGKKQAPDPPRRQCSIRNTKNGSTGANSIIQDSPITNYEQSIRKYSHYDQVQPSRNSQQYIPSASHQPIYVNYSVQTHQTTVEIHCDKTHDTKSNSSIDSIDTIPFANENTGTIKQRFLNRQDISSSLSLSSSSSSSSTNTVANIAQSLHSIKSTSSSLHEVAVHNSADHTPPSPTLPSPTNCPGNSSGSSGPTIVTASSSGGVASSSVLSLSPSAIKLSPLDLRYHHAVTTATTAAAGGNVGDLIDDPTSVVGGAAVGVGGVGSVGGSVVVGGVSSSNTNDSVNVLNDIGNMLANLTDELDAMLEEEKRVGINDSE